MPTYGMFETTESTTFSPLAISATINPTVKIQPATGTDATSFFTAFLQFFLLLVPIPLRSDLLMFFSIWPPFYIGSNLFFRMSLA